MSLAGDLDLTGEALLRQLLCLSPVGLEALNVTCLGVNEASKSSSLVKLPDLLTLPWLMEGSPLVVSDRR